MKFEVAGCYDLHIHTAPDVISRKLDDVELARRALDSGMAGFAIKSHAFPTAGRAAILQTMFPQLQIFSGIALNRQVGGINPYTVEAAAKMGAKLLWFPTLDAKAYLKAGGSPQWQAGLSAFDPNGTPIEETLAVLEVAKAYDMVVNTGHLGSEEAYQLVALCRKMEIDRICLTHVTLPVCQMNISTLQDCCKKGAFLEYSYCHILSGKCSLEYVANQIRAIGAERIILSTDLGQANNPYPVDGLIEFCTALLKQGISSSELELMTKVNPRKLLLNS